MKKLFWISLVLVFVLSAGLVMAAKPALRVGTDATYEPFETIDPKTNEYVGFDMELIKMVADEMGMELKLQNVGWDGIIPGLMNGNYDCLISAMTITADRKKQINFSTPYHENHQVIVIKTNNTKVKGPSDLVGKTVAVQNGTTGDLYASNIKNAKMKRFDTNPQAVQELLNNGADAAVMDDLVAFSAVKKSKGLKVVAIKDAALEEYGIGVKKGNDDLLNKINKAIATLKSNGKLAALEKKYRSAN
ncbi:amino acid ABC transporter substrate-binding protein (PAAT family) [Hydrogenispora ethanolica]|jgi:polar amino acid transport system substrate-binding protein|uniref:Amino acid ABC transporter substrate-binding protein (PAAT family) n=1 Tax=Hydrogenispora ethanolica TaxID=1082276 RepID=A0A4R1RY37_HYDET|nr:basic amino acid ABC transporter substrate-binding protein [Hydrogenispora ethanolica]TCL71661.1 amino acid ABC transporter substrate-binding protein (PAAT family) [Hydrogenispora ethanolica]